MLAMLAILAMLDMLRMLGMPSADCCCYLIAWNKGFKDHAGARPRIRDLRLSLSLGRA